MSRLPDAAVQSRIRRYPPSPGGGSRRRCRRRFRPFRRYMETDEDQMFKALLDYLIECRDQHGTDYAAAQIHPGSYLHTVPSAPKYKADVKVLAYHHDWLEVFVFIVIITRPSASRLRRHLSVRPSSSSSLKEFTVATRSVLHAHMEICIYK